MNLYLLILALLLAIASVVGAFNKNIPGPVLAFVAVLVAKWAGAFVDDKTLWLTLIVTILTVVSGYFLPNLAVRYIGGTKAGFRGAAVATISIILFSSLSVFSSSLSTIIFTIVAQKGTFALIMSIVALLGALEGELRTQFRNFGKACRDTIGSALAYITGSGAKILFAAYVIFYIVLDIIICID